MGSMTALTLDLSSLTRLTDERFEQLCRDNPEMRLERTATGELVAMAPAGSDSGRLNLSLSAQLWIWNQRAQTGVVFDSSAGFTLPNSAIRAPDAAWIRQARWDQLSPEQKQKFAPICPDFVLELLSPSDTLLEIQNKMVEYRDNGAELGWLIDPKIQRVEIYRPQSSVEILNDPVALQGDLLLPGFVLDLTMIWGSAGQ